MLRLVALIGLVIVAIASAQPASAAKVVMRDGRVFEGTIVEENAERVVIEVSISNIRSKLTLPKHSIDSIERDPSIPPGSAKERDDTEHTESTRPPSDRKQTRAPKNRRPKPRQPDQFRRYFEIPIKGEFGNDIIPGGVEAGLKRAKSIGLDTIVFTIDSDGGSVWAANEIVEIMQAYENDFDYYAVITHAISASIWVALSCDEVFIEPDGAIGGAVIFSQSDSGEAAVDQKTLSIYRSKLAALGRRNGFDADLISAMIDPRAEVYYAVDTNSGAVKRLPARGPIAQGHQLLIEDDHISVLTLTGDQAVQVGFCRLATGSEPELLEAHVEEIEWRPSGNYGIKQMTATANRFSTLLRKHDDAVAQFKASVENAKQNDPANLRITRYRGRIHPSDRARWIRRAEDTAGSLNQAAAALRTLVSLEREAGKLGASGSGIGKSIDIETESRRISGWLDRLHRAWDNI